MSRQDLEELLDALFRVPGGAAREALDADMTEAGVLWGTRQISSSRELAWRYASKFAGTTQGGGGSSGMPGPRARKARGELSFGDFEQLCQASRLREAAFAVAAPLLGGVVSPVHHAANVLFHLTANPHHHVRKVRK